MLTNVRGDIRIPFRQTPDGFNHRLWLNAFTLRVIFQALTGAPVFNLLPPVTVIIQRLLRFLLLQQFEHLIEYQTSIADNRNIRSDGFRNRGRIDVDMQHGRIWAIFCQVIGRSIVKAHADGEDHIGMMHGHVCFVSSMHAQHPKRLPMCCRKRA